MKRIQTWITRWALCALLSACYSIAAPTVTLLQDLNEQTESSTPTGFTEYNGDLYFAATKVEVGREFFVLKSNGVVDLVADILPGTASSNPDHFTVFSNKVLAIAFACKTAHSTDCSI